MFSGALLEFIKTINKDFIDTDPINPSTFR